MNKTVESFKQSLETVLDKAKACLIQHDGIRGTFYVSDNGELIDSLALTLKPENKQDESLQMKVICTDPKIMVAAILMVADTLAVPDAEIESVRGPLKDHPDRVEAILLYVYTRREEDSLVRVIQYKKMGEQDYWFGDEGWTEVMGSQGLFENVFKM